MELWRNGGGNAVSRRNFFCPFSPKYLDSSQSSEINFFSQKISLIFSRDTCNISNMSILKKDCKCKILQVSSENKSQIFMKKKVYLRWLKIVYYGKKMQKKIGGSVSSAVVSSQFHIVLHKTTAVPNFRAVTLLRAEIMGILLLVSISGTSPRLNSYHP